MRLLVSRALERWGCGDASKTALGVPIGLMSIESMLVAATSDRFV